MIAQISQPFALGVAIFVGLLAASLVIGVLAERLNVPYTIALVVIGLAASFNRNASPFDFGSGLLFFFLPALLFEAAWNLPVAALKRTWATIVTLAVPGVLVTMFVVAALTALLTGLPWSFAFVLGAIVSATDPVAVIATFRRIRVPLDLQTIVEGESLANDGVAAVLFAALVGFAGGLQLSVPAMVLEMVWSTAAALAIGIASAYAVALLLRGTADVEVRTVGTILVAYGSYILADFVHVSGIFATIAAGIVLRALLANREPGFAVPGAPGFAVPGESFTAASDHTNEVVESFWGVIAFLANSLVFLLMGLTIQLDRLLGEPWLLLVALVAAIASRLVVAFALPPFRELRAGGAAWRRIIALSGIRGGLALALALSLPGHLPHRLEIVDAVFAIVLFTVIVQGLAIGPVAARLPVTAEA